MKKYSIGALVGLITLVTALAAPPALARQYAISGRTMGTFYTVKFISSSPQSTKTWQKRIDTRLREVNHRMSIFQKESEISTFNRAGAGKTVKISKDFHHVMTRAQKLHSLTHGTWDGTVKPLVDLWGFGTRNWKKSFPAPEEVKAALDRVGFTKIKILPGALMKEREDITLDLGSIAKGYGVEAITDLLVRGGIKNVLVEIGGELAARGKNKKGKPWSVGILRPDKKTAGQDIYEIVALDNGAIATSGNYRNFHEVDGVTFSHIIDPTTGYPVKNKVVSASVIAKDCTFADGLATALMVLPVERGLAIVENLPKVECLIIQKIKGKFVESFSSGFQG